jgi:hypothetical protein
MGRALLFSVLVGSALLLGCLPKLMSTDSQWKSLAQLVAWLGAVLILMGVTSAYFPR